jgi:hypothetical protein
MPRLLPGPSPLRSMLIAGGSALLVVLPALPAASAWATATPSIASVPDVTHAGRTLTVTGTGLEDTTAVQIGGVTLTVTGTPSDGQVTASVPIDAPAGTSAPLHLRTASGGDTTSATAVTIAAAPAAVTGLVATVGDHDALLSWTGGGSGPAVVEATPQGGTTRVVPTGPGTAARDLLFSNTVPTHYAVWAADTDGTRSASPAEVDLSPVPAVPTTLTMVVTATRAAYGSRYGVYGTLRRGGVALADQDVHVLVRVGGTATSAVRTLRTNADGAVGTALVATRTVSVTLTYAGDAFSDPATSPARVVSLVTALSAGFMPDVVVRPESTVLVGRLSTPLPGSTVLVQRLTASGWGTVAAVRTGNGGGWSWSLTPGKVGTYTYRGVLVGGPAWLGSVSAPRGLRVELRDLSAGLVGDDVLALKRQLLAQHYVPGTLDRSFGYDLTHAVMTFQKVERLPVTGRWTRTERLRMSRPHTWSLRYPGPGRAVEVDLTRQVLVLSEAGRVRSIMDVSTGTERPYTYQGVTDVAHTPRGRFAVYRQIDGMHLAPLGLLYKPSFFYQGWAVHGSGSVPSYPASHGCVRITDPNADRLFPLLVVGTPVSLYDE